MMIDLTLKIQLISDALIGKGEGWGATIDSDIVFDDMGLPYIPARRVKGSLRESALEVSEMFELSGIDKEMSGYIKQLFGKTGSMKSGPLEITNLYLEDYSKNRQWLDWLTLKYQKENLFSKEQILKTFTSIKQHTAIESNGIAKDTSLRTFRVLKRNNVFSGNLSFSNEIDSGLLQLLAFSIRNLRYLGTNRNRGLGYIKCKLLNKDDKDFCDEYMQKLINSKRG